MGPDSVAAGGMRVPQPAVLGLIELVLWIPSLAGPSRPYRPNRPRRANAQPGRQALQDPHPTCKANNATRPLEEGRKTPPHSTPAPESLVHTQEIGHVTRPAARSLARSAAHAMESRESARWVSLAGREGRPMHFPVPSIREKVVGNQLKNNYCPVHGNFSLPSR